ncbi:MAG: S1 RNA-binding domain-containing protein [Spirochaetes bacterium]|nr:S1 RNA-binding domain-containing protein [Spirochaetota bacterium]
MIISEKYEDNIDMQQVADFAIDIIEPNKILTGEIVTIDDDFAYVNVGIKTDGRVKLDEFKIKPQIGDTIDVLLYNKRLVDGMYVFSKTAADREKRWVNFLNIHGSGNGLIQGKFESSNSKGFIVDCNYVDGFLPFSQAADLKVNKNSMAEEPYWFKIISIDQKRHSVLLSRKEYIEEENKKHWDSLLQKYKVGDKIQGKVKKFVEFGVFVEVEGIEALLHKNDMSWKKVFKPKKLLADGEVRDFVILNIDRDEGKISLGLKQLTEDPWIKVEEKYKSGDVISGEVITLINFGAFVELEEGIDGFIESSEISWTKKNLNPKDTFKKGQKIEAKILNINKDEKKIYLGYKQLQPNPWNTISERFPVGSVNKSKIKKIMNFGIFVELEDGIDGLIHISDVSWDENFKDAAGTYKVDDLVEYKILEIKQDEMKISCGIKQLIKSPWEIINEKYPSGSRVSGTISGIVSFGLFVKIEDDVEGLVHISEVSHKRIENLPEKFKVGDEVNVEVLGIDVERKRLSLSMKKYDAAVEKEELNKMLNNSGSKTVTIGDFIKIKLGEK